MSPSILVLTDFSAPAAHALTYAADLALSLAAPLVVLHVDPRPSLLDPDLFTNTDPRLSAEATAQALAALIRELPVPAVAETGTGPLLEVVAHVAARHETGLLVVGRPHTEDLPDELVTTLALDLLRALPCPLLVVPYNAPPASAPRRLLLAADAEPFTLGTYAGSTRQLVNALDAQLTVVHVASAQATSAASGAAALEAVLETGLAIERPAATLYSVINPVPAEGILAAMADLHPDLVLLLARPRSYLANFFHHSVTAQVIRQSSVPVLVVPVAHTAAGVLRPPNRWQPAEPPGMYDGMYF